MSLKLGEVGKIIRVAAGFDMSSNTELTLTFELPDGTTTVTKTKSGSEVVLGTSNVTDADLGALLANQYAEYDIEAGFLSQAGTWKVKLTYTNTTPTPDDIFIGDCVSFPVTDPDCPI